MQDGGGSTLEPAQSMRETEYMIEGLKDLVLLIDQVKSKLPPWFQEVVYSDDFKKECDAQFAKTDTDGNGVLSPDELYPLILELAEGATHVSCTEQHCRMFSSLFDTNKDGVISKEEFGEYARFLFACMVLNDDPVLAREVMALRQEEGHIR